MARSPQPFQARKISEHVYWVGAVDWDLKEFHGYLTQRGTTYNAYLVLADKITLIDTVKKPYYDEMMARIASVIDPADIALIVSNHAEADHSGCLPETIAAVRPERVLASPKGVQTLQDLFGLGDRVEAVTPGGWLDVGGLPMQFVETRMVHWPDSMVSYLGGDGILFSQDAFGMHLAGSERFADDYDRATLLHEAEKYYANIVLPYSAQVGKVLDAVPTLGWDIRMIAPDHGPIFRTPADIGWILTQYRRFVEQTVTPRAVVVYDTMWHSTERMAKVVAEGLAAAGVGVRVFCLNGTHRSDIMTAVMNAGALVLGSPTLNGQPYPTLADFLTYAKGLKPRHKIGAVFGSYGWTPKCYDELAASLKAMEVELVSEPVLSRYSAKPEDLMACLNLGRTVGKALQQRCGREPAHGRDDRANQGKPQ
ncbi:MAG: Rubredoxin-oxygen oxidoreductase [Lentisphaerae bacterium ADurb.BinA184]|nr:MAG: Rubredoxin-oxygen oxidoreductase [Lentisphaerae bacterium ADurb.BinA184]